MLLLSRATFFPSKPFRCEKMNANYELLIQMRCEKHKKSTTAIKILVVDVCCPVRYWRWCLHYITRGAFYFRCVFWKSKVVRCTQYSFVLDNFELLVRAYMRACVQRVFKEVFLCFFLLFCISYTNDTLFKAHWLTHFFLFTNQAHVRLFAYIFSMVLSLSLSANVY